MYGLLGINVNINNYPASTEQDIGQQHAAWRTLHSQMPRRELSSHELHTSFKGMQLQRVSQAAMHSWKNTAMIDIAQIGDRL